MKMTQNEKLTLFLAGLALTVSLVSLGYDIWQDLRADDEDVSLRVAQWAGDYDFDLLGTPGTSSPMIPTRWIATVENNGPNTVSFTSYTTRILYNGLEGSYTGIDQGLFEIGGEPLGIPLIIESHHAKRFVIQVGYLVEPEVYQEFSSNYDVGDRIRMSELRRELAERSFDIWGNRVEHEVYGDQITISYPSLDSLAGPTYQFSLTSTGDTKYSAQFAPYISLFFQ